MRPDNEKGRPSTRATDPDNTAANCSTEATVQPIPASQHPDTQRQEPDTCRCGRLLPDWTIGDRQVCPDCLTDADAELIDATLEAAQPLGITEHTFPYGPNRYVNDRTALIEWALARQLKLARPARTCLHWLTAGRCHRSECVWSSIIWPSWADHTSAWTRRTDTGSGVGRNGHVDRLLACQPYQLGRAELAELAQLAQLGRQHGDLGVRIGRRPWYSATHALVELWSSPDAARQSDQLPDPLSDRVAAS